MKSSPYSIIKSPVVTEKSMTRLSENNQVVLWVDVRANKTQIKVAVQEAFEVKVEAVNTQKVPGKVKRMGRHAGRTPVRKKAYVTLKEGEKIEMFEGV
ncbi:MAG: 50S ribosomal protein L23 [Proteobacteria bacterium]|nr:50S ribosomal protein L23 [Pseudomonadota bacterium]